MKQFLILAALIVGSAFGQLRFSAGAFYGDIAITSTNTPTLLGSLPAGACITGIRTGWAVHHTNVTPTTSNYLQVGIVSQTNYFLASTNMPPLTYWLPGLAVSNAFRVLSTTKATPIYGYQTRLGGAADSLAGTIRVVIEYVQK